MPRVPKPYVEREWYVSRPSGVYLRPAGRNPFARVGLLPCEGRRRVATEEEYRALLEKCSDDAFRDVLVAMRYTSARPQDVYSLTWAMVDWDNRMWVLERHKGS